MFLSYMHYFHIFRVFFKTFTYSSDKYYRFQYVQIIETSNSLYVYIYIYIYIYVAICIRMGDTGDIY